MTSFSSPSNLVSIPHLVSKFTYFHVLMSNKWITFSFSFTQKSHPTPQEQQDFKCSWKFTKISRKFSLENSLKSGPSNWLLTLASSPSFDNSLQKDTRQHHLIFTMNSITENREPVHCNGEINQNTIKTIKNGIKDDMSSDDSEEEVRYYLFFILKLFGPLRWFSLNC